jgi:hypothetical protein
VRFVARALAYPKPPAFLTAVAFVWIGSAATVNITVIVE